ncbi:MAG: hypothetical protein IT521_05055 [Burkholderiales bacterium]|nr:hypothetical protein [Burkholderiales bacterium]
MNTGQLNELVLQTLEHEMGGIKVYETALQCAMHDDLRSEWEEYLAQTRTHVEIARQLCSALGIDDNAASPGREVVRTVGGALIMAMKTALAAGNPEAAQLVACECVVLAETKDHLDWELIGKCAEKAAGPAKQALTAAFEQVENQEDEHLNHTRGWCRELWIKSLGMRAVLPPPEERHHVKTAIGAARAEIASSKSR